MKQTKKPTRTQKEILSKKGIDVNDVRVISEDNKGIIYISKNKEFMFDKINRCIIER